MELRALGPQQVLPARPGCQVLGHAGAWEERGGGSGWRRDWDRKREGKGGTDGVTKASGSGGDWQASLNLTRSQGCSVWPMHATPPWPDWHRCSHAHVPACLSACGSASAASPPCSAAVSLRDWFKVNPLAHALFLSLLLPAARHHACGRHLRQGHLPRLHRQQLQRERGGAGAGGGGGKGTWEDGVT